MYDADAVVYLEKSEIFSGGLTEKICSKFYDYCKFRHEYDMLNLESIYKRPFIYSEVKIKRVTIDLSGTEIYQRIKFRQYLDDVIQESSRRIHKRTFLNELWDDLMVTAWHPSRAWDWCFDNEHKEDAEKLWNGFLEDMNVVFLVI